jgi:hypothetical protein
MSFGSSHQGRLRAHPNQKLSIQKAPASAGAFWIYPFTQF